jgi:hypothetical protein
VCGCYHAHWRRVLSVVRQPHTPRQACVRRRRRRHPTAAQSASSGRDGRRRRALADGAEHRRLQHRLPQRRHPSKGPCWRATPSGAPGQASSIRQSGWRTSARTYAAWKRWTVRQCTFDPQLSFSTLAPPRAPANCEYHLGFGWWARALQRGLSRAMLYNSFPFDAHIPQAFASFL